MLSSHSGNQTSTGAPDYLPVSCRASDRATSFLFRRSSTVHNRRQAKILTMITSIFTSSYIFHWSTYLPDIPLKYPPTFDGRIVLYPSPKEVLDYFSWRQADSMSCHFSSKKLPEVMKSQLTSITSTIRRSGLWFSKVVRQLCRLTIH